MAGQVQNILLFVFLLFHYMPTCELTIVTSFVSSEVVLGMHVIVHKII
jgi:hypothetical protein